MFIKYGVLDQFAEADKDLRKSGFAFDDAVNALVEKKWSKRFNWIQEYDVSQLNNPGNSLRFVELTSLRSNKI